jgi:hypothetical protein
MKTDPVNSALPMKVKCALGLMMKVPFAGPVKIGLTPPLTPEKAATLSMCLRDMTTNVSGLSGDGKRDVERNPECSSVLREVGSFFPEYVHRNWNCACQT